MTGQSGESPAKQVFVVELTSGFGWYKELVGQRFLVARDMAGSKGLAHWRLEGPGALVFYVGNCISMVCTRFLRAGDCRLIED